MLDFDLDASDGGDYEPEFRAYVLFSSDSESESESEEEEPDADGSHAEMEDTEETEPAGEIPDEVMVEEAAEAEVDDHSDENSEVDLAFEVAETVQPAEGRSFSVERIRHDFLPEGVLSPSQPFVTTFSDRQFKQIILEPGWRRR